MKALPFLLKSKLHDLLTEFELLWAVFELCKSLPLGFYALKALHTDSLVGSITVSAT